MARDLSREFPREIVVGREEAMVIREKARMLMGELPVMDAVRRLPDLTKWTETGSEMKIHKLRKMLGNQLYAALSIGDHRLSPTEADPMRTPYHNLTVPLLEEALAYFGVDKFQKLLRGNKVDELVREMGDNKVLQVGTNPDSGWVSLAASTGSTPELWQYYAGLKTKDRLEQLVKGKNYESAHIELHKYHVNQQLRIKESYGFAPEDVLYTTQSGTEDPLLNILFGVTGTQVTDETGTSQVAAASGRHTSPKGWKGYSYELDPETKKMPKLAGYENVRDAYEVKMRGKDRLPRPREEIKNEVRDWILREREINPNSRLMLGVTAGGKTGSVGWEYGGLSLEDAVALRAEFKGEDGLGILIKVDGAQGKLSKEEIQKLKQLEVIFNWTGSKDDQGPMFESKTYVPEKYAELARDYIEKNGIPQGLTDYVVKSDLEELLGAELMDKVGDQLDDMPNIPAMIKWDMVLATREEYFRDNIALSELKYLVRDFGTIFRRKLAEATQDSAETKGLNWSARVLEEQPNEERMSSEFESLMSIEISINGKVVTGEALKKIQYLMGEPGVSGVEVQWGQAVSGAEVVRMVIGKSARIGLMRAWSKGNGFGYTNKLCDVAIGKLREVIESNLSVKLFEEAGIAVDMKRRHTGLSRDEMRSVADTINQKMQSPTIESVNHGEKLKNMATIYAEMFDGGKVIPVVEMGGENDVQALDLLYKSWGLSAQAEELPITFIDNRYKLFADGHPIVEGSPVPDYERLSDVLKNYPHTHLYIFGAGDELVATLNRDGWGGRFSVCSKQPTRTNFEYTHPDWTEKPADITEEQARALYFRHIDEPTRQMHDFFENFVGGRTVGLVTGQKEASSPSGSAIKTVNVDREDASLRIHVLTPLRDEEIRGLRQNNIQISPSTGPDLIGIVQERFGLRELSEWER